MRRAYLDQAEWIELTKAALERPVHPRVSEALEIARYGVRQGLVRFPLSSSHYMETMGIRQWRQREPLARLMAELSGFETIADFKGHSLRYFTTHADLVKRQSEAKAAAKKAVAKDGDWKGEEFVNQSESLARG